MKPKCERNLLEGNIYKNLLAVATPTMLGYMVQMFYDLVDMMWIGKISADAVAGVTIFSTMFWIVNVLNEIIGTSSISLISQSYGKGDSDRTSLCIEQTLTFKFIVSILAGFIFIIILKPLLGFFTKDLIVAKSALDYGYIRIFFLPIMFSSYSVNTAFRCVGEAKIPMITMILSAILNIILDPILMFDIIPGTSIPGFNLGVFGAALATVISMAVGFLFAFGLILSRKTKVKINVKRLFKLNFEIDKKLLTIGLPNGFEVLLRNLLGIITLKFITSYGTTVVAAFGIGNRLSGFMFMPLLGLSMGCSTIVGQCLGSENIDRATATAKSASLLGSLLMATVSIIAMFFPTEIMSIFINDNAVIEVGIPLIRIILPASIFAGIMMGFGSVFSGSGYNKPYLISSFVGRWLVQIPIMYVAVNILSLNVNWVWLAFVLAEATEMFVILFFYKKGDWKIIRV